MSEALSTTVLDGRYRLGARLGDGAMGTVYRGERVGLGREVAIKLMNASLPGEMAARDRFEREAQVMAKLAHPNCVSVIDFGVHEDKPYLVMDLVRGTNLHELIVREGKLPIARVADIARQILAGLAHAHAQGIIHRDIKPGNIMVSPKEALGDHVQILDFGLARLCESSSLTRGITVGTPSYMAPELCRGDTLDGRTDLYAVGCVIFEMATGDKPFGPPDDPLLIVKRHLTETPPPLGGPLGAVVARALAKRPDDRYASAVEMADAIAAAVPAVATPRRSAPVDVPVEVEVSIGSSALVPLDDEPAPEPQFLREAPPPSAPIKLDPEEASNLRRQLPQSRMKWVALLLVMLVAGSIYGIIRLKAYLNEQAATHRS